MYDWYDNFVQERKQISFLRTATNEVIRPKDFMNRINRDTCKQNKNCINKSLNISFEKKNKPRFAFEYNELRIPSNSEVVQYLFVIWHGTNGYRNWLLTWMNSILFRWKSILKCHILCDKLTLRLTENRFQKINVFFLLFENFFHVRTTDSNGMEIVI